ncbi:MULTISPECIES: LysR family transcriptional regulator [unclassified Brevundimonas]|jgi:DNA-binding transcriptional LysR family regulator|uniref:LysR family transcriptional regulator n=1 Tax=unclassified Brevundimonas TaxID=2622653 RepID=UPI0025C2DD20|nr:MULTISPECIES: LysR family transcriptional regulator [unclassified Brevundimonas]
MDLHGIDLNLLVAFDALISERSVTRAGMRIGRTQPAMSAALMRLRRLMDDELFVRGPQGLQPTQRALELAEPISVALGDIQRTLEFTQGFDPARSGMSFTLGLSSHAETVILPRLMAILSDRAPGVDLRVRSFTGRDDAIRMLDAGEVDVSVGIPPSATARILTARLFQERFVCVVRKDHPFALRPLDPKTFQALAHVVVSPENEGIDVADAALASKGWSRRAAATVGQMSTALQLVAGSDMIATVMESAVTQSAQADRLAMLEFPLALNAVPFVLAWHRRNDVHPAQTWLRSCFLGAFPHVWQPSHPVCADLRQQYY